MSTTIIAGALERRPVVGSEDAHLVLVGLRFALRRGRRRHGERKPDAATMQRTNTSTSGTVR